MEAQFQDLSDQLARLDDSLATSASGAASFGGELARMRDTMTFTGREVGQLSSGMSSGLRRALEGVAFDGLRLSEALKNIGKSITDTVYATAMRPVTGAGGDLLSSGINAVMSGLMPFAQGGAFSQGRITPFAKGGVVSNPVSFPMRGGAGLMGEAGPEAIMPLTRGADGRLGVQAQGGGRAVNVVMNITTPDVQSFRRSEAQIAAQMGRALSAGSRNR